jgi:hypothetical protein
MGSDVRTNLVVVAIVGLSSGACSDGENRAEYALQDVGAICVNTLPWGRPNDFCHPLAIAADRALRMTVWFPACSCYHTIGCQTHVVGERVIVSASATIPNPRFPPEDSCGWTCRTPETECETEPLPAGNYVVEYGEARIPLGVGSQQSRLCAGDPRLLGELETSCCDTDEHCGDGVACVDNACEGSLVSQLEE